MRIKYEWKILSLDGLLKEPEPYRCGYYNKDINGYEGGFDTEQEAEKALYDAIAETTSPYGLSGPFVLVKVYEP